MTSAVMVHTMGPGALPPVAGSDDASRTGEDLLVALEVRAEIQETPDAGDEAPPEHAPLARAVLAARDFLDCVLDEEPALRVEVSPKAGNSGKAGSDQALSLAVGIVASVLELAPDPRVCGHAGLSPDGLRLEPAPDPALPPDARARCELELLILAPGEGPFLPVPAMACEESYEAILCALEPTWPLTLAEAGRIPWSQARDLLARAVRRRVACGVYPSGVGARAAAAQGLREELRDDSFAWLRRLLPIAPRVPSEALGDFLCLLTTSPPERLGREVLLRETSVSLARTLMDTEAEVPPAERFRLVECLFRALSLWQPRVTRAMLSSPHSEVPEVLSPLVSLARSLEERLVERVQAAAEAERQEEADAFFRKNPSFPALMNLLASLRGLTSDQEVVRQLGEQVPKARLELLVRFEEAGPARFNFRSLDGSFPDSFANSVPAPVALVEDSFGIPAALQKPGFQLERDCVYVGLPAGEELLRALSDGVRVELDLPGASPRPVLFWADGHAVPPPSLGALHLAGRLREVAAELPTDARILDVGAGTGTFGVVVASLLRAAGEEGRPRVTFLDAQPSAGAFAAASWLLSGLGAWEPGQDLEPHLHELVTHGGSGFRFLSGDARHSLAEPAEEPADMLVAALPCLPRSELLPADIWSATAGTGTLQHLLEHGLDHANRVIVQYTSIADDALRPTLDALRARPDVTLEVREGPPVAFAPRPLQPFLFTEEEGGAPGLYEQVGRPYLEFLRPGLVEAGELAAAHPGFRDGGFRYFQRLRTVEIRRP